MHDRGVPVCRPALTRDGDPVVEIDARGYCVLPWLDGTHPAGPDLTHEQVRQLGVVVGRLHQELNGPESAAGLPTVAAAPTAPVVTPANAIAEAHRFQAAASAAGGPFDATVIDLLDQRIALIDRHAAARPTADHPTGPHGWTHGDLQYRSIIWAGGAIGAVIDWDRIRIRPFAQEIARTATIQFATPDALAGVVSAAGHASRRRPPTHPDRATRRWSGRRCSGKCSEQRLHRAGDGIDR